MPRICPPALLLLVTLAIPGTCGWAATYTVSPGDDVLAAMNRLQPGDTLQLAAGTYPPPQRAYFLSCAGTDEAPVTIEGIGTVVLQAKHNESGFTRKFGFHTPVVNIILRNLCIEGAGVAVSWGDGLRNVTLDRVEIRRCMYAALFKGATDAGGTNWRGPLTMRNCSIHDNQQGISIGGNTALEVDDVTIEDCRFERNWRYRAVNCPYTFNSDNTDGIAAGDPCANMVVRGCTFIGHGDGGIDCKDGLVLEDCYASDNATGLKLWGQRWPSTIRNCVAVGNRNLGMNFGSYGMGSGSIECCTLADNGHEGLRIGCPPSAFTVSDTVVAGNHRLVTLDTDSAAPADSFLVGTHNCWWRPDQGIAVANAAANVTCTLPQLMAGALPVGAGTIFADPRFLNVAGGDVHVLPSSPLVGAGVVLPCVTTDYDGRQRGVAGPPTIGAFEVPSASPPPTPPNVAITPSQPLTDDALVAVADGSTDPSGNAIAYRFTWYLDGAVQSDLTTNTVSPARTTKGQAWRCVVVANNGWADSAAGEAKVTIGNSAPTAPTLTLAPTAPTAAQSIRVTVSGSSDTDGDAVCYAYRWFRWDAAQRAWAEKQSTNTARTRDALPATLTAKGNRWKCSVRCGDGLAVSGWTEVKFRIGNTPPPAPRLSLRSSAPRSIDDVVASVQAVTDADGDTVRYGFRWRLDGRARRVTASTKPSDTLSATFTRRGQVWVCEAWTGDGSATSVVVKQAFTIANSPPPAPPVTISPTAVGAGQAVTARVQVAADPDRDAVIYGYRWVLDGVTKRVQVTSATSDTLPSGLTRRGQVWTVAVRAGDGRSSSASTELQVRVGATTTASAAVTTPTCVSALSAVPTAAGAQIAFTLSAPASVQAEVLNIAGRPVRLITPGTPFESGLQSLVWTGQSDAGLPVPNGRYLIRVTARGADGTSSQALGTVSIQR